MVEYIAKNLAIELMHQSSYLSDGDLLEVNGNLAKARIKAEPAADVVPVVHGEWIKYTGMGKVQWMCSKCSAEEKNPKVANYCYHCGAKMDGGES